MLPAGTLAACRRSTGFLSIALSAFALLAGARVSAAEPAAAGSSPDAAGVIRLTTDGRLKQRPAWSPDRQWLAFARHEGATIFLFLRGADGKERRLTDRTDPEYDAVWSPDGKRLAFSFVKVSPNQGDIEVYLVGADGKNLTPLAVTAGKLSHEESPCWSPDGKHVAFSSTRDGNQELYVMAADGHTGDPRRLTSDPALDAHPAWSPDGRQIAFATNRWGDLELALFDLESEQTVRLTHSSGLDDYPAWSPDGRRIAFTSNRDGNLEIYICNRDGSSPRNLTRHSAIDNFACWSEPNRITFVSNRDAGFDIYVQPLADSDSAP